MIASLVGSGRVRPPADLYTLEETELSALPQVGERLARRLLAEIEASRQRATADGAKFLGALGLPGVGEGSARRLAQAFPSLRELTAATEGDLRVPRSNGGPGLGAVAAARLQAFLGAPDWREECERLLALDLGVRWERPGRPVVVAGSPLAGRTVVFTGELSRWTRAEATEQLVRAGALVGANLTEETDFLVVGERPGAKLDQARARGIVLIDEFELERLIRGAPQEGGPAENTGQVY